MLLAPLALMVFRLLVLIGSWLPLGPSAASRAEPRLGSIALVVAVAGALIGGLRAGRSGDRFACGFTGAMAGVLASAVGFALIRSVESLLGDWASSPFAVVLLWAGLGLAIALASWLTLPPSRPITTPPLESAT